MLYAYLAGHLTLIDREDDLCLNYGSELNQCSLSCSQLSFSLLGSRRPKTSSTKKTLFGTTQCDHTRSYDNATMVKQ